MQQTPESTGELNIRVPTPLVPTPLMTLMMVSDHIQPSLTNRVVTCGAIESSCSRSASSSSNHIWKECAGPGLDHWRRGISYGRNLTTCGLLVQKSSTSVRQRSGRCWPPCQGRDGLRRDGGNLNQLRHKLQPCSQNGYLSSGGPRGHSVHAPPPPKAKSPGANISFEIIGLHTYRKLSPNLHSMPLCCTSVRCSRYSYQIISSVVKQLS